MKPLPSQARLHELLHYNPETGDFFCKRLKGSTQGVRMWNSIRAEKKTGRIDARGYTQIFVEGTAFAAHRLAWMYVHGEDPGEFQVDHIDNVKPYNNRIANLRLATNSQNMVNAHRKGPNPPDL